MASKRSTSGCLNMCSATLLGICSKTKRLKAMSKRVLTRMESIRRKRVIAGLLVAATVGIVVFVVANAPEPKQSTQQTQQTVSKPVQAIEPPLTNETVVITKSVALIHATIEPETPVVYDPVREDIPLDAETQKLLYQACDATGIQYELALSVIKKETDFRNIVGDSGNSIGYMQIQPRWHGERMERLGVSDLADPYGNFLVGCDYLAELMGKEYGLEWALHAYNGGPSYANKMAKAKKVSQYAEDVLNYMNKIMEDF